MKVLLVDDHALFREGMAMLLRPLAADGEVLDVGSCEEAMSLLAREPTVQLVLMDIAMPGMSGLDGIAWLRDAYPRLPVVALSSADDRQTVTAAIEAGAMGFIPKSASSGVMLGALQVVLAHGVYVPSSCFLPHLKLPTGLPAGRLHAEAMSVPPARSVAPASGQESVSAVESPRRTTAADLGLTPRQTEVLDQLLMGKSAKVIGRELNLAPGTVKAHTTAVLRSLNATTRAQAVFAAAQLGYRLTR